MQLSDRDINAIKSIHETSRRKGDYNMAAQASDKIKSHLKIESSGYHHLTFWICCWKDYNYLSGKITGKINIQHSTFFKEASATPLPLGKYPQHYQCK